jgi:phosphopantetheine adenylyltransferase
MKGGIRHLRDIYQKDGEDFIYNLFNRFVIINEKIDASAFGFRKEEEGELKFFKKDKEINYVDRVLSQYYEKAIQYIEKIYPEIKEDIPPYFYFGFEYFAETNPQNIDYGYVPKNNLILSYIHVVDENYKVKQTIQNRETLNAWADFLNVDRPPIIYEGYLSDEQKTQILDFIHTSYSELVDKFKTKSFTKYIISVLTNETEVEHKVLGDNKLEGVVFRFYEQPTEDEQTQDVVVAKLIDPMFEELIKKNNKSSNNQSSDYVYLIVVNLLNFIESFSPAQLRIQFQYNDEQRRYIELVNYVYKKFIDKYGYRFRDLEMEIPEFLKKKNFDLNYQLIEDSEIESLINDNETYKEIYRIFINFFRRKRKKKKGLFTSELIKQFNSAIDKINNIIQDKNIFENKNSSHIQTFDEFIEEEYKPGNFVESLPDNEEEDEEESYNISQPEKVNLLIGRFQPIHSGHIKAAKELSKKNKYPVLFVIVNTGKSSNKSPFSADTVQSLIDQAAGQFSYIKDSITVESGFIEEILKRIRPDYDAALIGAGEDRVEDYKIQLKYLMNNLKDIELSDDFGVVTLPRFVSGTKIREFVKNNDYQSFKQYTPKIIHSHFHDLYHEISSTQESSNSNNIKQLYHYITQYSSHIDYSKFQKIMFEIEQGKPEDKVRRKLFESMSESEIQNIILNLYSTRHCFSPMQLKLNEIINDSYSSFNLCELLFKDIESESRLSNKLIHDKTRAIKQNEGISQRYDIEVQLSNSLEEAYATIHNKIDNLMHEGILSENEDHLYSNVELVSTSLSNIYEAKSSHNSLGKGEVLACVVFEDVELNKEASDVCVVVDEDQQYKTEIKSQRGRLIGNGYDFGSMSSQVIDNMFKYVEESDDYDTFVKSLVKNYKDYNDWNLTTSQVEKHPIYNISYYLVNEQNHNLLREFVYTFIKSHNNLFRTLTDEIVEDIVNELNIESVNEDSISELYKNIRKAILGLNVKYYQMSEGFDYLWLMNENLDNMLINKRLIIENGYLNLINELEKAGVKIFNLSYSPQSRNQGSFCQISI